jgi:hypothetical protein
VVVVRFLLLRRIGNVGGCAVRRPICSIFQPPLLAEKRRSADAWIGGFRLGNEGDPAGRSATLSESSGRCKGDDEDPSLGGGYE